MSFDSTLQVYAAKFSNIYKDQIGSTFVTSRINTEKVYKGYAEDQYRDHAKNMMRKAVLDVIEKDNAFGGAAAENFARAF